MTPGFASVPLVRPRVSSTWSGSKQMPGVERQYSMASMGNADAVLPFIPDSSTMLGVWDVYVVFLLIVTAYFEPYSLGVIHPDPRWAICLSFLLDVSFVLDMCLQFFVAYPMHIESNASRELWVRDLSMIAKRYCAFPMSQGGRAGWFWIDLLSVFPAVLQLCFKHDLGNGLLFLRFLRLFRVSKFARLEYMVQKMHEKHGFPFYVVELGQFLLITTLTCHWLACAWMVVEGRFCFGKVSYSTNKESWLSALIAAKGDTCDPDAGSNPNCVFSVALYWAAMTLTTVGYGDITPQNQMEYIVCTFCILFVAYVWAYIVGKIVMILESLDPSGSQFRQRMDDLQVLMDNRGLPYELQVRLRTYMHQAKLMRDQTSQAEVMKSCVSTNLQREAVRFSGVHWDFKKAVYWARGLEEEALLEIVRALTAHCYGPQETMLLPQHLIMLRRGIAAAKGRILNRGDVWGLTDILLVTESLRDIFYPVTFSHVDVVTLSRESLVQVCTDFPLADHRLRRAQIRAATWRAFVQAAKISVVPGNGGKVTFEAMSSFINLGLMRGRNSRASEAVARKSSFGTGLCNQQSESSDIRNLLQDLSSKQDALERKVDHLSDILLKLAKASDNKPPEEKGGFRNRAWATLKNL
eukprot:CAMPEP_0117526358 /NCGR_PEP_ID=MMETSP0784-20121206/36243_1 /TAXON_ID=39447 /ORGANISM="" /LENGTH=635 /DNA_ID=CAMNT_0005322581 /DNA_START=84 /DNA_END=1991 /DNA_ORIENTATION=-